MKVRTSFKKCSAIIALGGAIAVFLWIVAQPLTIRYLKHEVRKNHPGCQGFDIRESNDGWAQVACADSPPESDVDRAQEKVMIFDSSGAPRYCPCAPATQIANADDPLGDTSICRGM